MNRFLSILAKLHKTILFLLISVGSLLVISGIIQMGHDFYMARKFLKAIPAWSDTKPIENKKGGLTDAEAEELRLLEQELAEREFNSGKAGEYEIETDKGKYLILIGKNGKALGVKQIRNSSKKSKGHFVSDAPPDGFVEDRLPAWDAVSPPYKVDGAWANIKFDPYTQKINLRDWNFYAFSLWGIFFWFLAGIWLVLKKWTVWLIS